MSSFKCDKCGKDILEGTGGHYVTGCEHYPIERRIMSYDSKSDTLKHIGVVQEFMRKATDNLHARSMCHDKSKLKEPEKSVFDEFTPKLKKSTYGSDEYKGFLAEMKVALEHHYSVNSHHPEYYTSFECNGCFAVYENMPARCSSCGFSQFAEFPDIGKMSLMDLLEMVCDWKAATMRHADGDIVKSIEINKRRFRISSQLNRVLINTINELCLR